MMYRFLLSPTHILVTLTGGTLMLVDPHTRYVLTGLQRVVFLTATESNKAKIKV